jgi:hypothetical protein
MKYLGIMFMIVALAVCLGISKVSAQVTGTLPLTDNYNVTLNVDDYYELDVGPDINVTVSSGDEGTVYSGFREVIVKSNNVTPLLLSAVETTAFDFSGIGISHVLTYDSTGTSYGAVTDTDLTGGGGAEIGAVSIDLASLLPTIVPFEAQVIWSETIDISGSGMGLSAEDSPYVYNIAFTLAQDTGGT